MRLREVVPARNSLAGERVSIHDFLNRELTFTAWTKFENERGEGLIIQFFIDQTYYVFLTHSKCLMHDIAAWESKKGREVFRATIIEKRTHNHNTAFVFI
ncbi:MAG: hypothetical protein J6P29_00675 [Acetobacter sp.]|nr:hypothetical protein [Acetobacter sp.]